MIQQEQPTHVSDKTKSRVNAARKFGGAAIKVSSAVVGGVYQIASSIAETVAAEIKDTEFGKKVST